MTSKRISDQIDTIRAAAEKASASPEAALAFLRSAGIIAESNEVSGKVHKRSPIVSQKPRTLRPVHTHSHPIAIKKSK
jgi:hypothetical protein